MTLLIHHSPRFIPDFLVPLFRVVPGTFELQDSFVFDIVPTCDTPSLLNISHLPSCGHLRPSFHLCFSSCLSTNPLSTLGNYYLGILFLGNGVKESKNLDGPKTKTDTLGQDTPGERRYFGPINRKRSKDSFT